MPLNNADSIVLSSPATAEIETLVDQLSLHVVTHQPDITQLVWDGTHIAIHAPDLGNPIFIDFVSGKNAHRRQFGGGRGQPLARAMGLKKGNTPTVMDATAGFGRDAFVIASLGCHVQLIERQTWVAALLQDGLHRAQQSSDTAEISQKMHLVHADAISYLQQLNDVDKPDVVYLDPMYPTRDKAALVKKDMRLLHQLAGSDIDSAPLLVAAKAAAKKRVVVKRPSTARYIAEQKAQAEISSKTTRYDVYIHTE